MKPVRAMGSMANIQSDAMPVGHCRTWVLAYVMPPLHYRSMVTTILHYFGRRRKCSFEYLLHEFHHLFRNLINKVSGIPKGGRVFKPPPPKIPKVFQNRAKLSPILKTVKNC